MRSDVCNYFLLPPSIYQSHFRVMRSDQEKINSTSKRSSMHKVELIRLVRGVTCSWEKVNIVVPSLDDSNSWRIFSVR